MSKLARYSSSEQELLKLSPLWAFLLVAKADGKMDEKEYKQFLGDLDAVLKNARDSNIIPYEDMEIVNEVFRSVIKEFDTLSITVHKYPLSPLEGLKKANTVLDSLMTKSEAELFKKSLVDIAVNVADSSGGLGFLSNNISKIEAAVINDIKTALRQ